jgi:hypothetical protein
MSKIYPKTLPTKTKELIKTFQKERSKFLKEFYLSGGTALSLQLGHRESIDLDFFNQNDFDPKQLQPELEKFGKLKDLQLDKNTLNAFLKGVQIQFLGYPYPLLKPTMNWQGTRISSVIDIACTKLQTIGIRGNKKDFIDLYFILNEYSLKELFKKLDKKYRHSDFSKTHILKSLVYFKDAEQQPIPKMHKKVKWEKVKKEIEKKVTTFSF